MGRSAHLVGDRFSIPPEQSHTSPAIKLDRSKPYSRRLVGYDYSCSSRKWYRRWDSSQLVSLPQSDWEAIADGAKSAYNNTNAYSYRNSGIWAGPTTIPSRYGSLRRCRKCDRESLCARRTPILRYKRNGRPLSINQAEHVSKLADGGEPLEK